MTAPATPPAARDAGVGERVSVSVDAAAWAELEAAFQRAAEAGTDWEWKAEAVDHLLWPAYDNLQDTARPLAPVPSAGAVDAAEAAEMVDGFVGLVCTTQEDDFYLRPEADQHHYRDREMAARRALIDALTTPPPAPVAVTDRGTSMCNMLCALGVACDNSPAGHAAFRTIAAQALAAWAIGGEVEVIRAMVDTLLTGKATPAHDADAAGEAVGDD